jgi:dephospho-CoA kinase
VANYLAEKGFLHISTGDILREEMRANNIAIDRVSMHNFVFKKRKERGGGYLVEEAIKRMKTDSVISGFRNTAEIEILKSKFGKNFVLVAVKAPIGLRYKWAGKRGRIGDEISLKQFILQEKAERKGDSESFDVDAVISFADYSITNNHTTIELFQKVDDILGMLRNVQ